jgi:hypothetical protein
MTDLNRRDFLTAAAVGTAAALAPSTHPAAQPATQAPSSREIAFDFANTAPGSLRVNAAAPPSEITAAVFTSNVAQGVGGTSAFAGNGYNFGPGYRLNSSGTASTQDGIGKNYVYFRIDTNIAIVLTGMRFAACLELPGLVPQPGALIAVEGGRDESFADTTALGVVWIPIFNPRDPAIITTDGPPEEGRPPPPDGRLPLPRPGTGMALHKHFSFNWVVRPGGGYIRLRVLSEISDGTLWYFGDPRLEYVRAPSDALNRLAGALPSNGDNPIGKAARAALVGRVKQSAPHVGGKFEPYLNRELDPYEFGVDPVFRDTNLWRKLALAAVVQRIYDLDFDMTIPYGVRSSDIDIDKVRRDLTSLNGVVRNSLWRWYAKMLNTVPGPVKTALDEFAPREGSNAKADYIFAITSPAWINQHVTMYNLGTWQDPEWELYHHWCKLTVLGASQDEIAGTIKTIQSKGVHIPDAVNGANWTKWLRWYGGDIGGNDVSDLDGTLRDTIRPSIRKRFEYVISEGGPGEMYRKRF